MKRPWKQNRPFALAAALWSAGLVAFLVYLPVSLRGRRPEIPDRELAGYYRRNGLTPPGLRPAERVREAATRSLGELDACIGRAAFTPGAEFQVDAAADPARQYATLRSKTLASLRERAADTGLALPDELPPGGGQAALPTEPIDELLPRLALTGRVVEAALHAGLDRVAAISHRPSELTKALLAVHPVTVQVEGALDEVTGFVRACCRPADGGGGLVLRSVELSGGETISAEITLAALIRAD
ncbi:MAG: hypothetical protein ACOC70_02630 [bacterium]